MHLAKKILLCLSMFLGVLALFSFGVAADVDEKKEVPDTSKQEQASSPDISALKAGKNEDGSLRKTTPAEEKALADKIKNTLSKYPRHTLKTHPNGAKSLVTVPHSLAFSVATIDRNGKVEYGCSNVNGLEKKTENKQLEKAEE